VAKGQSQEDCEVGERFKATAVKLSSLPEVMVQDVAAALDIHPFMLSLWRKQVRERVIVARASKLDMDHGGAKKAEGAGTSGLVGVLKRLRRTAWQARAWQQRRRAYNGY
jgi:transposase-like protein